MCRSIKTLRPPYTEHPGKAEYHAAALQYVRKVSGFREPSAKNQAAFDDAVEAIAASTADLLHAITPHEHHTQSALQAAHEHAS